MIRHALSTAAKRNPAFKKLPRLDGEDNLAWFKRAMEQMPDFDPESWSLVMLLGGSDTLSFRIRVAQSHLRPDMLPSYWSEAMLVQCLPKGAPGNWPVLHVPLTQPAAPNYPPLTNGLVASTLADFKPAALHPNVALIALPVPQARLMKRLETFSLSRSVVDSLEHVLRWLAFSWGVARTGNPLHENYGLPSAVMLETLFASEEFDLTPGLESRASCPEAIWSAALRWQDYFKSTDKLKRAPFGCSTTLHAYPIPDAPRFDVDSQADGGIRAKRAAAKSSKR